MDPIRFPRLVTALGWTLDDCLVSTQRFLREVLLWMNLRQPNVLALARVLSENPQYSRITSEWTTPNGNIMEYIRPNPEADLFRLVSPLAVHQT